VYVQVYPDLDVRNIVESNAKEEISNWCDFGVSYCDHKFTVRPFQCLGERIMSACHARVGHGSGPFMGRVGLVTKFSALGGFGWVRSSVRNV